MPAKTRAMTVAMEYLIKAKKLDPVFLGAGVFFAAAAFAGAFFGGVFFEENTAENILNS